MSGFTRDLSGIYRDAEKRSLFDVDDPLRPWNDVCYETYPAIDRWHLRKQVESSKSLVSQAVGEQKTLCLATNGIYARFGATAM